MKTLGIYPSLPWDPGIQLVSFLELNKDLKKFDFCLQKFNSKLALIFLKWVPFESEDDLRAWVHHFDSPEIRDSLNLVVNDVFSHKDPHLADLILIEGLDEKNCEYLFDHLPFEIRCNSLLLLSLLRPVWLSLPTAQERITFLTSVWKLIDSLTFEEQKNLVKLLPNLLENLDSEFQKELLENLPMYAWFIFERKNPWVAGSKACLKKVLSGSSPLLEKYMARFKKMSSYIMEWHIKLNSLNKLSLQEFSDKIRKIQSNEKFKFFPYVTSSLKSLSEKDEFFNEYILSFFNITLDFSSLEIKYKIDESLDTMKGLKSLYFQNNSGASFHDYMKDCVLGIWDEIATLPGL